MNVLIAFGSTEGQTRKIAETLAKRLTELGHQVGLSDTSKLGEALNPDPADFDKIIVAGSVHETAHQEMVEAFAVANREILNAKPTLFISVSLAAAFDDKQADAQGYVDQFVRSTGWQPKQTYLCAGALRHGEYGYYKEQILARVVLEGNEAIDPTRDQEFTDWAKLAATVDKFIDARPES